MVLTSGIVYAAGYTKTIEVIVNNVNVDVNGQRVGTKGADYTLSTGEKIPFSIVYNGTTYLPMRKVSEALGKTVTWDNATKTVGISDTGNAPNQVTKEEANSRTNPATIGEKLTLECNNYLDGEFTTEITLTEVIRGQAAEDIVLSSNMFNDESGSGEEYILAKFRIKMLQTENDNAIDINDYSFEAVSENGIVYDDYIFVSGIEPSLSKEYYKGSEYEGYTCFLVDEGDKSIARFECEYNKYAWFKLN